ncbi:hypothetical protein CkaCkLH20_03497 [Colletotrichum karsti]|uniref:F-box domain-containing protein n=1 Tax=Colletotrichum karsti TaxID=1095194 RepID=A0A9P6IB51_9PEZI|nr:uncharacterized protein CkaCkLH20_03497 [Colletotrichum karsti]KAF9879264.1 hypothetical protein CkaCkLH20_03497 [Colletotrichum karsti]
MRLASKQLRDLVQPHFRIQRVFISANPRNVEVFRAVAEHESFRHRVQEIVWDDARLLRSLSEHVEENGYEPMHDEDFYEPSDDEEPPEKCPRDFWRACRENIERAKERQGRDPKSLPEHVEFAEQRAAQLPYGVAHTYYQKLLQQQSEVLATEADRIAFDWVLDNDRFPNLRRITVTPVAHGMIFNPLYPTPMIREFPYGFNYPLPRSWPTPYKRSSIGAGDWATDADKDRYRGFCIVTRALARQQRTKVPEFIIDGRQVNTGLTCEIFQTAAEPSEEYENLVSVIRKPGFTTLRLNLMVGGQDWQNWPAFRSGRLREALNADLRHFTFEADLNENMAWESAGKPDHFVPLRSIFPVEAWTNLRHFGLSGFLVKQDDLLDLLRSLPSTLRSVELSFLEFMENSGNYKGLLSSIRNDLGWRERAIKPRVSIALPSDSSLAGRAVWIDEEVEEYLYGDAENPYDRCEDRYLRCEDGRRLERGVGIERDAFEPRFERTWDWDPRKPDALPEGFVRGSQKRALR